MTVSKPVVNGDASNPWKTKLKFNIFLDNKAQDAAHTIGNLQLHGFLSIHGVANFLNVPYATIPARFKTAILSNLATMRTDLDATQYGPRAPQGKDDVHIVMGHMFERQSMDQWTSEMDCLHLNIYTPPDSLSENADKIPVLIYIHGGALNAGDNTTEFDGNHLVKRSMELGKPIIVVSVNYRLNVFGFLTSEELVQEALDEGRTPVLNQGINDQRLSLEWIKKHIPYFGGDSNNITLSGESAGGRSTQCHLKGTAQFFNRAIIQSAPAVKLCPLSQAQAVFDKWVARTGIAKSAPYQVKLARLRSLSTEELLACFDMGNPPILVEDPNWFADLNRETCNSLQYWTDFPSWVDHVIIGTAKHETSLFFCQDYRNIDAAQLRRMVESCSSSPKFAEVIYNSKLFKTASTPFDALVGLATVVAFHQPTVDYARAAAAAGKNIGLYFINLIDPFDTLLQGYSWHSFGVPIFFYQPACQKDKELQITANKMSEIYINYYYGNGAWEGFNVGEKMWAWDGARSGLTDVPDLNSDIIQAFEGNALLMEDYKQCSYSLRHYNGD